MVACSSPVAASPPSPSAAGSSDCPAGTDLEASNAAAQLRVTRGLVIRDWLHETRSQLTYHGLFELTRVLQDEELAVLFRNNHFSTLIKHNGQLFVLVTDHGFVGTSAVWETLNQVDGDSSFVDGKFKPVVGGGAEFAAPTPGTDEDLARMLQDQEFGADTTSSGGRHLRIPAHAESPPATDAELAAALQQQENVEALAAQERARQDKKSNCSVS